MKRFGFRILAIIFPWLVLLIKDNPGGAFIALFMQASGIGWIFATIWAFRVISEDNLSRKRKEKVVNETEDET